jgi:hypothetical protein
MYFAYLEKTVMSLSILFDVSILCPVKL